MKRQIKKLNTFNARLQAMSGRINDEMKYLTRLKSNEIEEDELDDIDFLWENLDTLCRDTTRYIAWNC